MSEWPGGGEDTVGISVIIGLPHLTGPARTQPTAPESRYPTPAVGTPPWESTLFHPRPSQGGDGNRN